MKYVQAILSLGLFGWASYAVLIGSFPGGDGGSSKTRALNAAVISATEQFGTLQTAAGLAGFGMLLALFFLLRRSA
ncbi:hypothetical protein DEA8626_00593 [Defluviimonas aquaemixtae]|uniref:Uncharacterized protein n=1 Tax=Albidovulum aquaemixtae TaxID=1542388 RepID=A0A2R8B345_9RHOB|nr:hypothetical protein [Defluviimonas aquaemixtae]SPH17079.1 hypothetical protein DEA8626_00593 [Defluviimonas aquaemixtae]